MLTIKQGDGCHVILQMYQTRPCNTMVTHI